MSAAHVLIVTRSDDWHEEQPDYDLAIECTEPEGCNGWLECTEAHVGMDPNDETSPAFDQIEDVKIHGIAHDWRYGTGWTTPHDGCIVAWDHDHVVEYGSDIASQHGEGRHDVDTDWDDWGLVLHYIGEGVTA